MFEPIVQAKEAMDAVKEAHREESRLWLEDKLVKPKLQMWEALLDAREKRGLSISALCRIYGTTNRRTVMDLLAEAQDALRSDPQVIENNRENVFDVLQNPWRVRVKLGFDEFVLNHDGAELVEVIAGDPNAYRKLLYPKNEAQGDLVREFAVATREAGMPAELLPQMPLD